MITKRHIIFPVIAALLPMLAFAQGSATFNNNPDNPLPSTTGADLETTAQNIESSAAAQYQFKNEGIFGCNQVAGANASAGTLAAIGGVYVPVNDAAVTLNTGILVYKECVLRPLQDRLRESASSALLKRANIAIQTGREGSAQHVVNRRAERGDVADRELLVVLTDEKTLEKLHPAFKDPVRSSIARVYRAGREPETQLECGYEGNVEEALKGNVKGQEGEIPNVLDALTVLTDPACNPIGAYSLLARISNDRMTEAVRDWEITIAEGRGFYPLTDNAEDPLKERILTPASVVQESFQQILGSPVRQLESANDIGQMVGALYAGLTTHIISDSRGLSGITQSVAGQPSYLEQVAKESSQGVIGAAVNAALTVLNASREIEGRYLAAMEAIAANLTQSINQIRSTERSCWSLIVPKAEAYAARGTCTIIDQTTNPPTEQCTPIPLDPVKINTSTSSLAFSQQVIDSQITPLANAALTNVQNSKRALGLIDQLIASVTNTASLNAQRIALQQLDTLVAQRALHTKFDAENAAKQRDDVQGAMATLVQDTAKAWGDSPDPSTGWCNVNNADIPRLWAERWKK
ncbi:hypothetical protein HY414_02130 [Candidatus Kaiserbacteria bacterium]|nr:hypothetical protein [Candidatus Kaiserbacteria bacterium]